MQGSELPSGLIPTGFTPYPGKVIPGELPQGVPAGLTLGNPGKLIPVGMPSFRVGMEFRDRILARLFLELGWIPGWRPGDGRAPLPNLPGSGIPWEKGFPVFLG